MWRMRLYCSLLEATLAAAVQLLDQLVQGSQLCNCPLQAGRPSLPTFITQAADLEDLPCSSRLTSCCCLSAYSCFCSCKLLLLADLLTLLGNMLLHAADWRLAITRCGCRHGEHQLEEFCNIAFLHLAVN